MHKLTDREQRFVVEYAKDRNGAQSCIRAGYAKKAARQTATKMLAKPYIQDAIAKHDKPYLAKVSVDIDYVLTKIKTTLERCEGQGDENFNPTGVLKATEQLGRYLGMYHDNVSVNANVRLENMSQEELDRALKASMSKHEEGLRD